MSINKDILKLSLPAIINNITVPLLGLCDTAIAGHLGNSSFLAAMSVAAMMLNVLFWLFGFLRMGTTGITAMCFGASDRNECFRTLYRAFMIAITISLIILLFKAPILNLLLMFVGAESNITELASAYYDICIFGLPAQFIIMVASGWFIGMQTTLIPMFVAITVNIINISLNILLAFSLDFGFKGIAYATLIANWTGAFIMLFLIIKRLKKHSVSITLRQLLEPSPIKRLLSVNSDLFLRSACVMGVSLSVTAFGARMGGCVLATNAVLLQFFTFFSYFMDGFAFAGEALTGKFKGASDLRMLRIAIKNLLVWSACMAVTFFLIYLFFSQKIISLLTDAKDVLEYAPQLKPWILALPPATVLAFIYDGFFIGVTKTRRMLVSTFIAIIAFAAISLIHPWQNPVIALPDNKTLWTAFETYLFFRGFLLMLQTKEIYR